MLIAAAVVPEAPLLLPGATGAPITEVEQVRAAAGRALSWVLAQELDLVVAVAGWSAARSWPRGTSLGIERRIGAAGAERGEVLPVGLAVLVSLLPPDASVQLQLQSVARAALPADVHHLGALLASSAARVGLLVSGDGSARRGPTAPGYADERAAGFDAMVEQALRAGDAAALLGLDAALAADLLVAGRAAWQVFAGAAQRRAVRADLDYAGDPFGVQYFVARWAL